MSFCIVVGSLFIDFVNQEDMINDPRKKITILPFYLNFFIRILN